jgi:acetyl esterase/lipase
MGNWIYYHADPPGADSKIIRFFLGLFGMKKVMEKKIAGNRYRKEPAPMPKSIQKKFHVVVEVFQGRKVWVLSPKNGYSGQIILYLHGGVYFANITTRHWLFLEHIVLHTKAKMIVPDYPLAPEFTCKEAYRFLDGVYTKAISDFPAGQFVFMGDSAGGGLALGFAEKIKNERIKQPEQLILFSPWLDASMTNPEIAEYEKLDRIVSVKALKMAGEIFAGEWDVTDFCISPIYGDFSITGKISIFIGTHEVLIADARKWKKLMEDNQIGFNYFEYPEMFHDWVVITHLRETRDVLQKIVKLLGQGAQ